jgi:hypothetical protein
MSNFILSRYYITQSITNESQFQPHKVYWRYGVLRRADLPHLPRDCLFLIRKDIGRSWQRFHRRKRRLGGPLEGVWVWVGEGGVSGMYHTPQLQMMLNNIRA